MNPLNDFSFAAEDIRASLQAEINNLDKKIEIAKRAMKKASTFGSKVTFNNQINELRKQRDEKVRNFFNNQDAALEVFGATL